MSLRCPLKVASSSRISWIGDEGVLTYRDLDALADAWAASLAQKGVRPGSRVAFLPHPTPQTAALFFGIWRLGAAACPLHLRLLPSQREALLKRLEADVFVPDGELPAAAHLSFDEIDPELASLFLMTSGSTGEPKIAALSFRNLYANAKTVLSPLDLRSEDRWLLQLPLFHVGGIGILIRCILAGAAIVSTHLYPHITHLSCVPTQLYRATPVYQTLRCVLLGGAPVPSYPERLPIVVTYGLTEMASMVLAKSRPVDGYLGFALPNREIKLGCDGEIFVRGECLFQGYLQEGKIEPPNPWFATGDLAHLDPVHGIQIRGRKDWQFISGGENIQPEEIEQHILQIPGVKEVIVIPRPDPEFGHRPAAFVSGELDLTTMREYLRDRLPKYKIPVALSVVQELPKKGLKVDRGAFLRVLSVCQT